MLFHDSKDESAWALALVGVGVVSMAAFLGSFTGKVQPTAPYEESQPDVSSPMLHEKNPPPPTNPEASSPYPQPEIKKPSK